MQTWFGQQVLKLFLVQSKDVAKECAKLVLPMLISCNNRLIKNYCIDYGCEAVWAGYYEGLDAIPGACIKYACVDACYHQLSRGAQILEIDYPARIKNRATFLSIARVFIPLFTKRCIAQIFDTILNHFWDCDQENDKLWQAHDFCEPVI
jgi:hypothetical protein